MSSSSTSCSVCSRAIWTARCARGCAIRAARCCRCSCSCAIWTALSQPLSQKGAGLSVVAYLLRNYCSRYPSPIRPCRPPRELLPGLFRLISASRPSVSLHVICSNLRCAECLCPWSCRGAPSAGCLADRQRPWRCKHRAAATVHNPKKKMDLVFFVVPVSKRRAAGF